MNPIKNQIRVNHRIRVPEVRVIGDNGAQIGVMPTSNAMRLAAEKGLDLVEIAPDAKPPVCRIVNFGKFRYEQAKKHKGDAKNTHASKLKELKFSVNISEHDYSIKVRHATEFLEKGMRVKASLYFRGREMQHQEYGLQLMRRIIEDLANLGHTDSPPRLLGKNLHIILVPGKAKPKTSEESHSHGQSNNAPHHSSSPSPSSNKSSFGTQIKIDLKPTPEPKR